MERKEMYQEKLQAKLDELQARIMQLKAQGKQLESGAQLELQQQIEALRVKQQSVKDKMAELSNAGEDAWQDLKSGINKATDELAEAVRAAGQRFR